MSTQPIRVFIADGQPIVLEGLRRILSQYPGIQVVGEAADGIEVIEKALQLEPDIILLDFKLPRVDGLAVLRSIQSRVPHTKVIIFTSSDNKDEFVEAMRLGCSGILLKEAPTSLIEKSIQRVQAGEIWLDSNTTAAVIRHFASPKDFPAAHTLGTGSTSSNKAPRERAQLSQREREIIVLIAQGYKNKEIAEKMFITEQTVKNHLHNVFDKLGVSDRLELALYAIHNSLHVKV
jgi:two-component system nitrate/nitrite response regulator NarL